MDRTKCVSHNIRYRFGTRLSWEGRQGAQRQICLQAQVPNLAERCGTVLKVEKSYVSGRVCRKTLREWVFPLSFSLVTEHAGPMGIANGQVM